MVRLTSDDVEVAVLGGSVLACGGGGWVDHGLLLGQTALGYGPVDLASLDELPPEGLLVTVAAIGAPAARGWHMDPRDYVRAAELVIAQAPGPVVGFMTSQIGSSSVVNAWLPAAVLDLPAVDVAGNGRAHPTARMGAMGLDEDNGYRAIQAAVGGAHDGTARLELLVKGTTKHCANILRTASTEYGGFVASARNPISVQFARTRGAVGAVSQAIGIGRAISAAQGDGASAVIDAIVAATGGRVVGVGEVIERPLETRGAFDFGHVSVLSAEQTLRLLFMNEFMAVDGAEGRLFTFPDGITVLSLADGLPVSIANLTPGDTVAVLVIDRSHIKLGGAM